MTDQSNDVGRSDAERILNLGQTVILKKLGQVIVKELTLENLIEFSRDVLLLMRGIDFTKMSSSKDGEGLATVVALLHNKQTIQSLTAIVGASTDRPATDYKDLGVSDWLTLIIAIKTANDWEEIKKLFFQLVPKETLQKLLAKKTP